MHGVDWTWDALSAQAWVQWIVQQLLPAYLHTPWTQSQD